MHAPKCNKMPACMFFFFFFAVLPRVLLLVSLVKYQVFKRRSPSWAGSAAFCNCVFCFCICTDVCNFVAFFYYCFFFWGVFFIVFFYYFCFVACIPVLDSSFFCFCLCLVYGAYLSSTLAASHAVKWFGYLVNVWVRCFCGLASLPQPVSRRQAVPWYGCTWGITAFDPSIKPSVAWTIVLY